MIDLEIQVPEVFCTDKNDQTPRNIWESMLGKLAENPRATFYRDENGLFIPVKVPMIIIVNGAGGTGKDTATDLIVKSIHENSQYHASRLSTVDLVYEAVNKIFLSNDSREQVKRDIREKGDAWRQFMHEVKMSWTKYCNGPTQYILNRVFFDTKESSYCSFYFVMLREVEEIKRFIRIINLKTPYLYSTIFVKGITNADSWQNDCDHNVREELFDYDVIIENCENDFDGLIEKCSEFSAKLVDFYNRCDIIPMYKKYLKDVSDPDTSPDTPILFPGFSKETAG